MKLLVAAFAACASFTAAPAEAPVTKAPLTGPTVPASRATIFFIDGETIPRVVCPIPGTFMSDVGSGVRVSPTDVVTAYHVTERRQCYVDGDRAETVMEDPGADIAVLRTAPVARYVKIGCEAIEAQHLFLAAGHADGSRALQVMPLVSNGTTGGLDEGDAMPLFDGLVFEGMSGGAAINMAGEPVGILLQRLKPLLPDQPYRAAVRLFRDTYLCA